MSIRIQIRDKVIELLNVVPSLPPLGVPLATKRRWIPGERISSARIAVYFLNEEAQIEAKRFPVSRHSLRVNVQCANLCVEPDEMDDSVEPLLQHANSRLASFYGEAGIMEIREVGTRWESGVMDSIFVVATAIYEIDYQTARSNGNFQAV